ncbi:MULTISPECIES: PTS ascorbate transporter subunit IIC [Aerococcus]|uniref:PTS ascorbate transporter subunit IIC n=1 Tax=Aerococcus TaxID=1375 RepID=UPI000DCE6A5A|nr:MULTISPECIES: PTS ascorbate transporter subunit IIC [Aerococcus]KAA9295730.1 PTS transporter subunit IIC [Aerococcus tenax]MDK6688154.1 PTS ascorbate transporter subunit IIC [Aerococcus urinae]MDK8132726.1 PTS ascorbate transporter subunit IIC [Aerococcus urinae]MDK8484354.1 PTS ascorbate transporter subunit IIC [Aerococcus urinae]MDL5179364.1 PTS ascorbate transporter subunit IIC [Aerococcus tenax]
MEIIMNIFTVLFNNIISKPQFFLSIIVFVGYLLLNKTFLESLAGAVKAAIGYMILQVGSSGMVKGFAPILEGLLTKYNISAAVIDSNLGFAAANQAITDIGESLSSTMFVLLIGFAINILLVALKPITKVRTLFTTGHIMVKQAGFITWMIFFALPEYRNLTGIVIIGTLIGLYWAVFSNLTVEPTEALTEGERFFAVGHSQMGAIWLTDKISNKLVDPEDSVENVHLPKNLKVLSDNVIGTTAVMLLMFGSVLLLIGQDTMSQLDPDSLKNISFATYIIEKSFSFTASFLILQTGVKMFVNEITTSFQGISDRLLKGSVPAVDCAATYGFASGNTVLIGFLFGFLGQLLAIIGLLIFKSPIFIISGFVPLFFDNGTLAVYANNKGGRKAAMLVPFINGISQVLLGAVGVAMFGLAKYGGWYGNIDVSTIWIAIGGLIKQFSVIGVILSIIIMLLIPQLQYKFSKDKEKYF